MKKSGVKPTIVLANLLILFFSIQAFASDFNPPEWRNSPGSTYQKWSFSTSNTSPVADDYNNPYGTPAVTDIMDGIWVDQKGNQQGIWEAQAINFSIPNDTTTLEDTKYRVEMIWNVQATTHPDLRLYVWGAPDTSSVVLAGIVEDYYIPDSLWWKCTVFEVVTHPFTSTPVIYYEAEFEHLSKITPIYIDEVIIDTLLIPEPATLALLGLSGLLIGRKK